MSSPSANLQLLILVSRYKKPWRLALPISNGLQLCFLDQNPSRLGLLGCRLDPFNGEPRKKLRLKRTKLAFWQRKNSRQMPPKRQPRLSSWIQMPTLMTTQTMKMKYILVLLKCSCNRSTKKHPCNTLYDQHLPVYISPESPQKFILITNAGCTAWAKYFGSWRKTWNLSQLSTQHSSISYTVILSKKLQEKKPGPICTGLGQLLQ
ncbi:hypothetical protein VP01_3162g1 [Puccinia sorghi]|uniref:Uncharacterized protein n=1 Tax=Puccinia sorghi TaxID=27349 RepID=A0A0L6UYQ7_9BASI|nr:hypothetical protein VP01_3162g1 [Puccinia sorghi]